MYSSLQGKTLFITGSSRGIGLAIALRAAQEGANIAIAAKTVNPHPMLPGTIHSAVAAIEAAGGKGLAIETDIRDEDAILRATNLAGEAFGGIDILVNNASAIHLCGTADTTVKKLDLMLAVNMRGTFLCSQACLPLLKQAAAKNRNPQILNLAPPPSLDSKWFSPHLAYTLSKFGMSFCTLGMAAEFIPLGIKVNALWPKTLIATAALQIIPGIDIEKARKPEIVAEAAYHILTNDHPENNGNFYIDEAVLRAAGMTDFSKYSLSQDKIPAADLFLD